MVLHADTVTDEGTDLYVNTTIGEKDIDLHANMERDVGEDTEPYANSETGQDAEEDTEPYANSETGQDAEEDTDDANSTAGQDVEEDTDPQGEVPTYCIY